MPERRLMFEHHRKALDGLVALLRQDPAYLAIISTGSVARDSARPDSDVDVYLVVDDEEYFRRSAARELVYHNREICDYPGGYVDGKVLGLSMLKSAKERASEPMRASFAGAKVCYSVIPDMQEQIAQIAVYPEENREQNLKDFYAQVYLYGFYFANQADGNPYLLTRTADNLVLFGGRIVLAYNRILFPSHKGLMQAVSSAPQKPADFMERAYALLQAPNRKKCRDFAKMMLKFADPGITYKEADARYLEQNEWSWSRRECSLEER